jgi:type II secretory pathway pseudopilin PulG
MSKVTKRGFTIIEILTVLSIIIIIISLLVPALQAARKFAKKTTQKGQFYEISKALELFRNENRDALPDSGAVDTDPTGGPYGYCGAMKLCEAILGQDGMGYHPSSRFWADETTNGLGNTDIYLFDLCISTDPGAYDEPLNPTEKILIDNLRERKKYIDREKVRAVRLQDLYRWNVSTGVSFYDQKAFRDNPDIYPNPVITDVYTNSSIRYSCSPRSVGMPVLYYKADPSKLIHDVNIVPAVGVPNPNIYNFDDNFAITALGCPWEPVHTTDHPMMDSRVFLKEITNKRITSTPTPHNEEEYILMSAGFDGLYGTDDDVFNFAD